MPETPGTPFANGSNVAAYHPESPGENCISFQDFCTVAHNNFLHTIKSRTRSQHRVTIQRMRSQTKFNYPNQRPKWSKARIGTGSGYSLYAEPNSHVDLSIELPDAPESRTHSLRLRVEMSKAEALKLAKDLTDRASMLNE